MTTLRYRAESTISYARALYALTVYAHDHHDAWFDYGPLQLEALLDTGLIVAGPGELESVRRLLEEIQGLYPSDE